MRSETSVIRDVILPEGTTLRLRAATSDDAAGLLAFVERLSPESRYFRFHGLPPVGPRLVEPFLDPDWDERGALVGTFAGEAGERIVALGTWSRLRDRSGRRGSLRGRRRVPGPRDRHTSRRAACRPGRRGGHRALRRGSSVREPEHARAFSSASDSRSPASSTEASSRSSSRSRRRSPTGRPSTTRDHLGVVASLGPFFSPRGVAVYGASPRAGTIGGLVFRNIVDGGFPGDAYPVNRRGEAVAGVGGYTSLTEVPRAMSTWRSSACPASTCSRQWRTRWRRAVAGALRHLCRICRGRARRSRARSASPRARPRARRAPHRPELPRIAVSGPRLNATFAPRAFPPGRIAFSSQSGALGLALLERSEARGLGFSAFVSIGNKADVSSNDLLEFWEEDPDTDVVLLYLESFGNPRKFGRLARRISRRKPVLAMKSGVSRAGAKAASSHTAALAGSDAAVAALFRQAGVIRAEHGRGAGRRRRDPVDPAAPRGKAGRRRDERRRARNPLRRRLRCGRARARELSEPKPASC